MQSKEWSRLKEHTLVWDFAVTQWTFMAHTSSSEWNSPLFISAQEVCHASVVPDQGSHGHMVLQTQGTARALQVHISEKRLYLRHTRQEWCRKGRFGILEPSNPCPSPRALSHIGLPLLVPKEDKFPFQNLLSSRMWHSLTLSVTNNEGFLSSF